RLEVRLRLGQLVEVRIRLGIGGVDLVQPLPRRGDVALRFLDRGAHRRAGRELRLLLEEADLDAGHADHFALVVVVDARHDLEQRRLARAVEPEHADLGAGEEVERDVLQDAALGRHELADPAHGVDVLSHPLSYSQKMKEIFAGAVFLLNPISAHAVDSVSAELGHGSRGVHLWRVGAQWNQHPEWLAGSRWSLYWDLSLGSWHSDTGTVHDVGLTPVF